MYRSVNFVHETYLNINTSEKAAHSMISKNSEL